jgi:ATP-dependent DNA helicase DinG
MEQILDLAKVQDYFKPQGKLDDILDNYEYRPQQEKMATKITSSFNQEHHLLVEAGTGTGKSFAYLIPSILLALQNEEQIVISTNTINLQEQLINKDLPLLQQIFDLKCNSVLAKGRGNYLCLRRLNQYQLTSELTNDQLEQLEKLDNWISRTKTGCRSDLNFTINNQLWNSVASESRLCLRSKCPNNNYCFFNQARTKLHDADIIVANHHLVFADISLRDKGDFKEQMAVLPHYQRIIFDEAHNVEEIATGYIGNRISSRQIIDALKFLYNPYKKSGDLLQLRAESSLFSDKVKAKIQTKIDNQLLPAIQNLLEKTKSVTPKVEDFMNQFDSTAKLRLTSEIRSYDLWAKDLAVEFENLLLQLNDLQRGVVALLELLDFEGEQYQNYEQVTTMLEQKLQIIMETTKLLTKLTNFKEEDEIVYWLEQQYAGYSLHSAPLNIAKQLQEQLLSKLKTVVFTSATLTVDGSFEFIKKNLGLVEGEVKLLNLGSPFNYQQQRRVGIIKGMVAPKDNDFIDQSLQNIKKIIEVTKGRTLILFNSYYRLNQVYEKLLSEMEQLNINNLFCQGKKPRQYLINQFKNKEKSVLLGTDSFWEGIDIPGHKLSCLIIIKLPFLVPSDPFIEAKLEAINKAGGQSFFDYMLPKAVIKFRQGCGRLIRNQTDKGWLFIFDNRVLTKSYGQSFLKSLAAEEITIDDLLSITKQVNSYFEI